MTWVERVWRYMPSQVLTPDKVASDGKGGVTQDTFDTFLQVAKERVTDKIEAAGLEAPDLDAEELSPVLESVIAQVTAAYVLRKFPTYEALYKDYFANGFATLDEYIAELQRQLGTGSGPEFVDEEGDELAYGFPATW